MQSYQQPRSNLLTLAPGDRVFLKSARYFTEWNWAVGEIVSFLGLHPCVYMASMECGLVRGYRVRLPSGLVVVAALDQIVPINPEPDMQRGQLRSAEVPA